MVLKSDCLKPGNARVGPGLRPRQGWSKARLETLEKFLLFPHSGLLRPVHIHEHEPRRIPDLVGKRAIAIGAALAERDIRSRRRHRRPREARRIGTEAL